MAMHSRGIRHLLTPIGVSPYRPLYAAFCRSIDHRGARQRTVRQARTSTAFRRHYARIAVQPTQDDVADDIASLGLGEGPSSSSGVVLRPYQEQAIDACLTALDEGVNRMGVSLPTGSGKTTIFMSLIPRIVEKEGKRKKTLILVNAVELATQAEAAGRRLLGEDWSIEMEQGKNQATGLADV
jgi:superfamily II DNA or RNA helicase